MVEFVRVNVTVVFAASAALCIVIVPTVLSSVTPVDFDVSCVTVPPAPVPYPKGLVSVICTEPLVVNGYAVPLALNPKFDKTVPKSVVAPC